jgi:16S rRNA G966 N2-methylase RsmD
VGAPRVRGTAFYYYGSKGELAHLYPAPRYRTIVEPFAGSASYAVHHLLAGNADRAILVEKDPRVVELWRRLLAMSDAELAVLEPPAAGERTDDFLFMTVAAGNAIARCRSCAFSKRAAGVWPGMHRSMQLALPVLRGRVEVIEGDYREVPVDGPATWFIDPPYQPQEVPEGSKTVYPKGMGYAPNCAADSIDYTELAAWCRSRLGQVIVCEQARADWLDFEPLIAAQDSQGKMKREVIWVQGDFP